MTKSELADLGVELTSEEDRCFGRLKARELTGEELDQVGGGDEPPPPPPPPPPPYGGPDVIHSGIFARSMNPETGEPDEIGNVYT
jgi:hypothetical protein